jgi:type III secretion protein R
MDLSGMSPGAILALIVSVAMLPYLAVMVTAFTKLVVVFSLLRSALGLQQTPPNVVLNGLAIILSLYVMYPVGIQMHANVDEYLATQSAKPNLSDTRTLLDLFQASKQPLLTFLEEHSSASEREFFYNTARELLPEAERHRVSANDLAVLVPAFTVCELARAFQIGFLIFLPFLVIDLIVSNILQALGMMMLSPTMVSLPFKLLLFVLLDGWSKLIHGLVLSY